MLAPLLSEYLLSQQNSSSLHCFAFADADFSPKTDVVRGAAPSGTRGAALTIHTLSLKGQKDLVSLLSVTACVFLSEHRTRNSTWPHQSPVA